MVRRPALVTIVASIRSLQARIAEADAELQKLRGESARLQYDIQVVIAEKASLERELRVTKERLVRAQRFAAAQTAYLYDVLDAGKG